MSCPLFVGTAPQEAEPALRPPRRSLPVPIHLLHLCLSLSPSVQRSKQWLTCTGLWPPSRSSRAYKEKGAEKCQQLPVSKGNISSEREQLPAAAAAVPWGGMLAADAKRLAAAGKAKGALCAAEPGTSLQRHRRRSAGLGTGDPTHLLILVSGSFTGLGYGVHVLPQSPHWAGAGVQVPLRTPQVGSAVCDLPNSAGSSLAGTTLPCPPPPSFKMMLPLCFCFIQRPGANCSVQAPTHHFCQIFCFLGLLQQPVPAQSTPGSLQSFY